MPFDAGLDGLLGYKHASCSRSLPFDRNSNDVAVNVEGACHYGNRRQFLQEVQRILKPGGNIAAMDWMLPGNLSDDLYGGFIRQLCDAWPLSSLERKQSYTRSLKKRIWKFSNLQDLTGRKETI